MIAFTINWENIANDNTFTTDYTYDGCGCQKGFDLLGWIMNCLSFGMDNGFRSGVGDVKLKNPEDYPERANELFQPTEPDGKSKFGFCRRSKKLIAWCDGQPIFEEI